uniref:DUF3437 domain-containing protein n=1 Tax=Panagrellus redivivus TaxID=6233 RepID=A0A7E4VT42_PANRE
MAENRVNWYADLTNAGRHSKDIKYYKDQCTKFERSSSNGHIESAKAIYFELLPMVMTLPNYTWSNHRKEMIRVYQFAKIVNEGPNFIKYVFKNVPLVCQIKYELVSVFVQDLDWDQLAKVFEMLSFALDYQDLASVITHCVDELRKCTRGASAEDYTKRVFDYFVPLLCDADPQTRSRASETFFATLLKQLSLNRHTVVFNALKELVTEYKDALHATPALPSTEEIPKLSIAEKKYAVALSLLISSKTLNVHYYCATMKWGVFSCHPDLARASMQYWHLHETKIPHPGTVSVFLKRVLIGKVFSGDMNGANEVNKVFVDLKLPQDAIAICMKQLRMTEFPRVQQAVISLLARNQNYLADADKFEIATHVFRDLDDNQPELGCMLPFFHDLKADYRVQIVDDITQKPLGYRILTRLYKANDDEHGVLLDHDLRDMRNRVEGLLQATGSPGPHYMATIAAVKQYYRRILGANVDETVLAETISREFADVIINNLSACALFLPPDMSYKSHLMYIINTILRVQDKRVVNEGLELLQYHLIRAKSYEAAEDFALNTVILDVLDNLYDVYIQPQYTCRPRAFWGVCMALLRLIEVPETKASFLSTTIKYWLEKRDHDVVSIRLTKLLCAYTKNSAFDLASHYGSIIKGVFAYSGSNTELISLFANLLSSIYSRVLKNELVVTPLYTFLNKHGSLFYWTIHYIISDERLPSLKGPLANILLSTLQRLAVIDYCYYDDVVQTDLKSLVHYLVLQLKDPDVKYRDLVQNVIVQMIPTCTSVEMFREFLDECGWYNWPDHVLKPLLRRQQGLLFPRMEDPAFNDAEEQVVQEPQDDVGKLQDRVQKADQTPEPSFDSLLIPEKVKAAHALIAKTEGTSLWKAAYLRIALSEIPEVENVLVAYCSKHPTPFGCYYYTDPMSTIFKLFEYPEGRDHAAAAFAKWQETWPQDYPGDRKTEQFCDAIDLFNSLTSE